MAYVARSREELRIRRDAVANLARLGLSIGEIAGALGVHQNSVYHDRKKLGIRGANVAIPAKIRREQAFRRAMRAFACEFLVCSTPWVGVTSDPYFDALKSYLNFERMLGISEGLSAAVTLKILPDQLQEVRGYRRLLDAVFGHVRKGVDCRQLLCSYLEAVRSGHRSPTRETLPRDMADWADSHYGGMYRVPLGQISAAFVDSVLSAVLSAEEIEAVKSYFGIGRDAAGSEEGINLIRKCSEAVLKLRSSAEESGLVNLDYPPALSAQLQLIKRNQGCSPGK